MEDPVRSKLDAIFRHHALSKRAEPERIRAVDDREAAILKAFAAARDTIIRPAMEEMGEYVKAQGYTYTIDTEADGLGPDKAYNKADIRLTLYVDRQRSRKEDHPGLTVFCDKSRGLAQFHARTFTSGRGGHAGLVGEFEIAEVTKELVQEKILAVIAEVFR
jgi:hypothetical protein